MGPKFLREHRKWSDMCEWFKKQHDNGHIVQTKSAGSLRKFLTHMNSGWAVVVIKKFAAPLLAVRRMDKFQNAIF